MTQHRFCQPVLKPISARHMAFMWFQPRPRFLLVNLVLSLSGVLAFGTPALGQTAVRIEPVTPSTVPVVNSALNSSLFYNILLGELTLLDDEPRAAYALILDSARRAKDEDLFKRAVGIALRVRSGDLAFSAIRAWRLALPESVEAARFELQILMLLNRVEPQAKALHDYLKLVFASTKQDATGLDRHASAIADLVTKTTEKSSLVALLEKSLDPYLNAPDTTFAAWIMLGRIRLAATDMAGVLKAAQMAQTLQPSAAEPALLALAVMATDAPAAEPLVKQYLRTTESKTKPEVSLLYARTLMANNRYADALAQAQKITQDTPDFASAWLVLGSLQYQNNPARPAAVAQASLKKFIELSEKQLASSNLENSKSEISKNIANETTNKSLTRAYLLLSQIAEENKNLNEASNWLAKISPADASLATLTRRASLLTKQGKADAAWQLLQDLPDDNDDEFNAKLSAQLDLLRQSKQYQRAYDFLNQTIAQLQTKNPQPANIADLNYELAMLADKVNKPVDMERLLRLVIAQNPKHQHAYNALGYSFAERNVRLPEAKTLIQKAVQLAPNDPYIADSLGWVEFKLGNLPEAERILTTAYKNKSDAEIAAHLGEVLWVQGKKKEAAALWKAGMNMNPSNDTLLETLKRLGIKP